MLPPDYGHVVLAALLLSMASAPLALRFNGALAAWVLPRRASGAAGSTTEPEVDPSGRILFVGFGRVGQNVARMLEDAGYDWYALDSDPTRVENARAGGAPVMHGDGTQFDVLRAAGVERARALALTLDDAGALSPLIRRVHHALPALPILVRARDDAHLTELQQAGATEVVPETLEAGLMVGSHLLFLLGIDRGRVTAQVRRIRHERYRLLRAIYPGSEQLAPDSPELRAVTLPSGAHATGTRLGGIDLASLGVAVKSLLRDGERGDDPDGETELQGGDILLLEGTAPDLDRAEARLVRL